jgi:hypothetical protein
VPGSELPDDASRWPGDPYALLGVSPGDDERQVRREYIRLIRRFRPDHRPLEFQKIREAFEFIQRQQQAQKHYLTIIQEMEADALSADDDEEFLEESGVATFTAPQPVSPSDEQHFSPLSPAPSPPSLAEIWRDAMDGDEAAAYLQLLGRKDHASGDERSELYARLYWLLLVNRDLDPAREPCDWLVEGLRRSRLGGPLLELYRRELAASADEGVGSRCASLLEGEPTPRGLVQLLFWRWRVCARIHRHELILQDLNRVRPRLVYEDEASWCRLMILACELLAWCPLAPLRAQRERFAGELREMTHLHQEFAEEFDRLDLLEESSRGWRGLTEIPNMPLEWKEMIPLSWTCDWDELRSPLLDLLASIAAHPPQALQTLDLIARQKPAAATQFGLLFAKFLRETSGAVELPERDWEDIMQAAAVFLRSHQLFAYEQTRGEMLLYCLHESIHPLTFAAAADQTGLRAESFQDNVRGDCPVQDIYIACQAFWC